MKQKQQESSTWTAPFQPLIDISNINFKATQKLTELQSNFATYLMDANIKQFKALAESKDIKSAVERQLEFFNEVDSKWHGMAEQEMEAARDAQQSISVIFEKNIKIPDFLEPTTTEVSKH